MCIAEYPGRLQFVDRNATCYSIIGIDFEVMATLDCKMELPSSGSPSSKRAGQRLLFVLGSKKEARVRIPPRNGGLSCVTWSAALPLFLFVSLPCARLVAGGPALGGGIQGTVKTPEEMPVYHAKVTLNSGSRIAPPSIATTTADGHYQITSLLPGAYVVCVEAAGYDGSQRDGIVVNTDAITVVDFTLIPATKSPTKERSPSAESPVTACQTRFFDDSGMRAAGLTGSVDPGAIQLQPTLKRAAAS